jgi:polysaccharide pyruvyl transferase WcaK-like protein
VTKRRRARGRGGLVDDHAQVGLFGLMGQGNLGNDASMEALLTYLRKCHSEVDIDVVCTGPELIREQYNVPTADLHWRRAECRNHSGTRALMRKAADTAFGMVVDSVQLAAWVRRHDAVIVPGMGVLETTVPMRAWKTPYLMFLLSASGRLFGTKVALVGTGANFVDERLMRKLITWAARLASYRSFRDKLSRDALEQMGLDISGDAVYPDVVFSLSTPKEATPVPGSVGVGVMDYCGRNVDRGQANEIRSDYIEKITSFALWLVDQGRPIRLITSDPVADAKIISAVVASLQERRPRLEASLVTAEPITCIGDLLDQTALVETVVATRYHNIVCALKLAKPTVSIGYATKCDVLMEDMGLAEFCQPVKSFDVARLIEHFEEADSRSAELQAVLKERSVARCARVDSQFAEMSRAILPGDGSQTPPPLRLIHAGSGTS